MYQEKIGFEAGTVRRWGDSSHLPLIPGMLLAAAVVGSGFVVAALMIGQRLSVVWSNWPFLVLVSLISATAIARILTHNPPSLGHARLRDFAENLLAFLAISALGAVASYAAAGHSAGFADARLEQADRLLRFDWIEWYVTVVDYPVLQWLGTAAYASVYVSPLVLIGTLAWGGELARLRQFLMTYWLSIVMTLLLFPLMPARGALAYLWHGPIPYMPTNGLYQDFIIPALRSHEMSAVDFGQLRGLVCAPSFHTVCGILFITFAWPVKQLRWTLVPVNLLMLLATPVEGTHYLTDMVLGAMVAAMAIFAVQTGVQWLHAQRVLSGNFRRGLAR